MEHCEVIQVRGGCSNDYIMNLISLFGVSVMLTHTRLCSSYGGVD